MNRSFSFVIFVFFLSACEFSTKNTTYPLHFSDATMGTRYTIKVSSIPVALNKDELVSLVKSRLDEIDGKMSTYRIDSELSLFNQSRSLQWQDVSSSLFKVLKEAKRVNKLTNSAFDITVAPLVNLWGFGSDPMIYSVPADEVINAALKKTGSDSWQINEEKQQIKKDIPDLHLDLSAIAKGYAVDQVSELLEKNGIIDYMVEIGGELRLKGKNSLDKPWRIAIEKPDAQTRAIQKVLPLSNISMATSGDYRNYFEVDNVRYSHTIDPRSGRPISHKLASITILSDTSMEADALATGLMVLGSEQGYQLAQENKIAALFISKAKDGFEEKATSAFIERLK